MMEIQRSTRHDGEKPSFVYPHCHRALGILLLSYQGNPGQRLIRRLWIPISSFPIHHILFSNTSSQILHVSVDIVELYLPVRAVPASDFQMHLDQRMLPWQLHQIARAARSLSVSGFASDMGRNAPTDVLPSAFIGRKVRDARTSSAASGIPAGYASFDILTSSPSSHAARFPFASSPSIVFQVALGARSSSLGMVVDCQ